MPQATCDVNAKPEIKTQLNYKDWYASTKKKAERPPLAPEEKARPFAKYFRDPVPPDPAHLAKMDTPCDPAKAIGPEHMNDLLNPGYLDVEIGWCNLPNGAGFIANCYQHKGVTAEMIDWWFAWHTLEDLRYRIWYPPQHGGIMISPETRKRMLDPTVPMHEKNWGATHHVTENCDCGMENIDISFMSPKDFGFDMSRWKEPFVSTFAGGYGWACAVNKNDESITAPAMMCHIFRTIPGGIEHRTRFWMGYRFSNGKPELSLPPGIEVPVAAVQGLARHNVKEFKNLGVLLPEIYKELGGKMEV
jgi:phloretin hydrolase